MKDKEQFESYQKTIKDSLKELSEKMDPDRIKALIWKSKLSFEDYKRWKAGEFKEPKSKEETKSDYDDLMKNIYEKHYQNPFTEPFKHNQGVLIAMYEFAQHYHQLKVADSFQGKLKSKFDDLNLGELKGKISNKLNKLFDTDLSEPFKENKNEK